MADFHETMEVDIAQVSYEEPSSTTVVTDTGGEQWLKSFFPPTKRQKLNGETQSSCDGDPNADVFDMDEHLTGENEPDEESLFR